VGLGAAPHGEKPPLEATLHCPAPGRPSPGLRDGARTARQGQAMAHGSECFSPALLAALPGAVALPLPGWPLALSLGDVHPLDMSAQENGSIPSPAPPCSSWVIPGPQHTALVPARGNRRGSAAAASHRPAGSSPRHVPMAGLSLQCFHVGFFCAQKGSPSKKYPRGHSFAHPVLVGCCTWPGNGVVRAARCQPRRHPDPSAALEICTHIWLPRHYLTPLQLLQATEKGADHNL